MKTRSIVSLIGLTLLSTAAACVAPQDESAEQQGDALGKIGGVGTLVNACGNMSIAPIIRSTTFAHPQALDTSGNAPPNWNPASGRYTNGGIQYVSGNAVRLEIATDGCTYLEQAKIGSTLLTPNYTNGYWYSVQDERNDAAAHVMSLWLFYTGTGDGSSDDVSLTFGRSAGSGTVSTSLPLVRVKTVQARSTDAAIGISGAEMYNMFAKSLYAKFNGATNSAVINGRRIYDYDANGLSVYIDQTGVWFSFKFKADVANYCDPTATVTGTFTLDANPPGTVGLAPRWINPVHASLDWGWCAALIDVPLLGLIADVGYLIVGDNGTGTSVQKTLTDDITNALPNLGGGALFLDGVTTGSNLLSVKLKLPFPSVEIAVPYDAFDMTRTATRVPAGQSVTLLATGLGMNDAVARVSPQTTLWSGPNGVPRDAASLQPNFRKVARAGTLVDSGASVAQLMAKTSVNPLSSSTWRYRAGCSVAAPAQRFAMGPSVIRFGVNDTVADAQRLRGLSAQGYSMRMFFGAGGSPCESWTHGPIVGG